MTIYLNKPFEGLKLLEKGSIDYSLGLKRTENLKSIGILNLMPNKQETEAQFLKLFNSINKSVHLRFLRIINHSCKNSSMSYLKNNYETLEDIKNKKLDGTIITGAPLEKLPFEHVSYWRELQDIFNFIEENVKTSFFICWAAQAAMYHYYGIRNYVMNKKTFGIYKHYKLREERILENLNFPVNCPHSRYSRILKEDLKNNHNLKILLYSQEVGELLLFNEKKFFMLGHIEYDRDVLKKEYLRDLSKGIDVSMPKNYFPIDNVKKEPFYSWKNEGNVLFSNWVKYYV
ncbi:homoserine O-acetyltransferase/O-succinyltransferase family protein [Haloimpatiens massiliensis]|uniref:homoserine O-acetyltransferase/O-succinyltransferase family protein n=1 Tax=Haloimpatiens massiliensis TaxID=1658110 RepID=UPI000C83D964|nr:homoserine O-succinyltransferase [Haloimpatiens massiliensis]